MRRYHKMWCSAYYEIHYILLTQSGRNITLDIFMYYIFVLPSCLEMADPFVVRFNRLLELLRYWFWRRFVNLNGIYWTSPISSTFKDFHLMMCSSIIFFLHQQIMEFIILQYILILMLSLFAFHFLLEISTFWWFQMVFESSKSDINVY